MKKKFMILLGIITVMACIGLTACGGGESEEPATEPAQEPETEAAEPAADYSAYGYTGEDPVEGAVYEYMATEITQQYEVGEGIISIPTVAIVDRIENEDGSVDVAGLFQLDNYTVEEDTLMSQSGGEHPGKMHLVRDGDVYKVDEFERVGDGSDFEPTARKIFGDKYEDFMKIESDDKAKQALRTETVANYVKANGLAVTKYQDYGWDPVELPL